MFLLIGILLPLQIFSQQTEDRVIKKVSWLNEPIKINKIKVADIEVESGKKFQGNNDWLHGLTVNVTNKSNKNICYIDIAFDFPRADEQPGFRDYLLWRGCKFSTDGQEIPEMSKPLKPGESIDIVLTDDDYVLNQNTLKKLGFPESIYLVEIRVQEIGFEGEKDTKWIIGQMFRRDPNNPGRWYPIKSENQY